MEEMESITLESRICCLQGKSDWTEILILSGEEGRKV
jgi:hypothetical protein